MAEKKTEKRAYGVFQEAIFEKNADGSYKPIDMVKEGMTTLKKHATSLTVICTDSSVEDMESMLKKNDIPYDKVIKPEEKMDFVVTGKGCSAEVYRWLDTLDNIGWQLSREKKKAEKTDQQKADASFDRWLKKQVKNDVCPCDY